MKKDYTKVPKYLYESVNNNIIEKIISIMKHTEGIKDYVKDFEKEAKKTDDVIFALENALPDYISGSVIISILKRAGINVKTSQEKDHEKAVERICSVMQHEEKFSPFVKDFEKEAKKTDDVFKALEEVVPDYIAGHEIETILKKAKVNIPKRVDFDNHNRREMSEGAEKLYDLLIYHPKQKVQKEAKEYFWFLLLKSARTIEQILEDLSVSNPEEQKELIKKSGFKE